MFEIILASSSPRRKELLEQVGLRFKIMASNIDENAEDEKSASRLAEKLAYQKAHEIARNLNPGYLVIGADTIVCIDDEVLGKPKDEQDAFKMLKQLSGKMHTVITGIALVEAPSGKVIIAHEGTNVKFRELNDDEILAYIHTGEPMDKAGAYGVQGLGAILVEGINGCYSNVVGLPIARLAQMFKEFGIKILG